MAIKAPNFCKNAVPTLKGWCHPKTGELLKSQRISQEDINEWNKVEEPTVVVEEPPVVTETPPAVKATSRPRKASAKKTEETEVTDTPE